MEEVGCRVMERQRHALASGKQRAQDGHGVRMPEAIANAADGQPEQGDGKGLGETEEKEGNTQRDQGQG
jgi:hypothetical protein